MLGLNSVYKSTGQKSISLLHWKFLSLYVIYPCIKTKQNTSGHVSCFSSQSFLKFGIFTIGLNPFGCCIFLRLCLCVFSFYYIFYLVSIVLEECYWFCILILPPEYCWSLISMRSKFPDLLRTVLVFNLLIWHPIWFGIHPKFLISDEAIFLAIGFKWTTAEWQTSSL